MPTTEITTVFSPSAVHGGFGDTWMCVNYLLHKSEYFSQPVLLSTIGEGWKTSQAFLYLRLAHCLNTTGQIKAVERPYTKELQYLEHYNSPYLSTKRCWKSMSSNIISYQFDGVWNAVDKNMTPGDEEAIINCCRRMGLMPINVGGMTPIEEKIDIMAAARFHVGVESGMAHVAISVGMPCFIILNRVPYDRIACLYHNRGSMPKFLQSAQEFIHLLRNSNTIMLL